MDSEIGKALIGLVFTGILGGILKVYLDYKSQQMEKIWEKRLEAYTKFVQMTALFPRYPPKEVTWKEVYKLSTDFRNWYFEGNGIFLSSEFRDKYFKLQEQILAITNGKTESEEKLESEYDCLRKECSMLRTLITKELDSRENPFWYRFKRNRSA